MQPLSFVYTQNAHKRGRERKGAGIDITENMSYNSSVAKLNPFRYRGYYYDTETGLYYLNSRYYDPSIGRFLNADDISYIHPTDINGLSFIFFQLNWRIEIREDEFEYRNLFRRKKVYKYSEVEVKELSRCTRFYRNGKHIVGISFLQDNCDALENAIYKYRKEEKKKQT